MNRNLRTPGDLSRRMVTALAALILTLLMPGCGAPAAPQPPSLNLPTPVFDLSAARVAGSVHLAWTMPTRTTDHLPLRRPLKVQLCRAVENEPCANLAGLTLASGAAGLYVDQLPADLLRGPDRLLHYEVSLANHAGKSAGSSNPAYTAAGAAPSPLTGLTAQVRADGVLLNWQKVLEPGRSILFRIERLQLTASVNQEARRSPLAPSIPAAEQTLVVSNPRGEDPGHAIDTSVLFNQRYRYTLERVASINLAGRSMEVQGMPSQSVEVVTTDVFPPAVPQGLAAIADSSAGAIDLSWLPDTESDLATYRVYRRDLQGGSRRLIASPSLETSFRDDQVQPHHTYAYSVSALDQNGNESRLSPEVEETLPNQ